MFFIVNLIFHKHRSKISFITSFIKFEHNNNANEFHSFFYLWGVSKNHIFDCINRVVEILCRLQNQCIKWSNINVKRNENLTNDKQQTNFIEIINKMDDIDIVLIIKFDEEFDGKLFFNRKKRYVMNLCVVCDSNR